MKKYFLGVKTHGTKVYGARFGVRNLLYFLIPLFFYNSPLCAQTWVMPVDGKVLAADDKLAGAIITLYKGSQQLQQVVTTSNGRFSFELPPNGEYIISVTKPGFINKKFKINTANVPSDRAESGGFNPFEPDVTLFEMPTAPEISKRVEAILSQPIAIYQYDPAQTNFHYDEKYTQVIKDKLAELAQLQKQAEKEVQEKAKNAALEAQKQLETDKKYKDAIAKADGAFSSKDYASAKTSYNDALAIKPAETYPKKKISEINKLLADAGSKQSEMDAKYQAAIKKGDGAFDKKDYAAAKAGYTEALGIKPAEQYPKQKLAEINKLLADAGKQKELDAKYQAAIAKGDGAFSSKDYTSAKTAYTEATGIKPGEAYPKQKLAETDKLLMNAGKQKELDAKYQAAITKGDGAFGSKDYASAKSAYTGASAIKPNEAYPKTKIAEIDKLLAAMTKAGDVDKQYKDMISKADNLFSKKDYASAKSSYSDASSLKPAEAYPKQKISEIDKLLADLAAQKSAGERDQQYKDAVAKADKLFASRDYSNSKSAYNEALGVKPGEAYPKTKIAEIDKLLGDAANESKQKDINAKYNATILKADNAFKAKDYSTAKPEYAEASRIKPAEQYPKDKLAEIDKIEKAAAVAKEQKEINLQYGKAIAMGDKSFLQKDLINAKSSYEQALAYKPNEKYPKDKILQINNILNRPKTVVQNVKKETKQITPTAPVLSEEEKQKAYQSELRSKYSNGITEEEYSDNGKKVLRRVVIRDDFAGVYTKVSHGWGGIYFFKDNTPITEIMFENETR